ncbi:MAG: hypothetical protein EOP56_05470 [Sphingobacteriales bacterium]|nr:MAG: hypothetical protein EOP56_05470 [Sphingobacteriales bacterium]
MASAQSYIAYQHVFNRVDEDVLSERLEDAVPRLDTIFHSYSFVYARHCIKALQISCALNDTVRADAWLTRAFLQGVPLWVIRSNNITKKALEYIPCQKTTLQKDSLHTIYRSKINTALAAEVNELLVKDYHYTRKVNDGFILFRHTLYGLQWVRNNKKEYREISRIIGAYGYPGERLIGLPLTEQDSANNARFVLNNGIGLEMQDRRVFFMLLHYYSSRGRTLNEKLYSCIDKGDLPAYQYARINDYLALYGKRSEYKDASYYEFHDIEGNTDSLNRKRFSIGLNTFEQQERNKSAELRMRKERSLNDHVILE